MLTPTRELAAQILEDLNSFAVHTPDQRRGRVRRRGHGPAGAGLPARASTSSIATPGRLLDHFRAPYAKLAGLEFLVLDEADRMLDMGFLPDIRRVLKHLPGKRQTLFFSATMPAPIVTLTRELLDNPATINLARQAAPAVGITQAVYPVSQELKGALLAALLSRGVMTQALVFTRTKHRADRLTAYLERQGVKATRIHGNRSQAQRTLALAGFKSGEYPVLVATDIAARGIDVSELGHVVNFDVPVAAEDYIHRVGRTGRAEATGEAFTFVSREEEGEWQLIEKVVGKRLPRVQLPDFDYTAKPEVRLEIPIAERIAAIRKRKAEERARAQAKAAARAARLPGSVRGSTTGPVSRPGQSRPGGAAQGQGQAGGRSRGQPARPAPGDARPPSRRWRPTGVAGPVARHWSRQPRLGSAGRDRRQTGTQEPRHVRSQPSHGRRSACRRCAYCRIRGGLILV